MVTQGNMIFNWHLHRLSMLNPNYKHAREPLASLDPTNKSLAYLPCGSWYLCHIATHLKASKKELNPTFVKSRGPFNPRLTLLLGNKLY